MPLVFVSLFCNVCKPSQPGLRMWRELWMCILERDKTHAHECYYRVNKKNPLFLKPGPDI